MFQDIEIDGQSRTAIRLLVETREVHQGKPAAPVAPATPLGVVHGPVSEDGRISNDGRLTDAAL
jgi:hypothetical protein